MRGDSVRDHAASSREPSGAAAHGRGGPRPLAWLVRQSSKLKERMIESIRRHGDPDALGKIFLISDRIQQLGHEWDADRSAQLVGGITGLLGIILGTFVNKNGFYLTALVCMLLVWRSLSHRSPLTVLLDRVGLRTSYDICDEVVALQVLRGDFEFVKRDMDPKAVAEEMVRNKLQHGWFVGESR